MSPAFATFALQEYLAAEVLSKQIRLPSFASRILAWYSSTQPAKSEAAAELEACKSPLSEAFASAT